MINYIGYPSDLVDDSKILLKEDSLDMILNMLDNDLNYVLTSLIPTILANYMIISKNLQNMMI